MCEQVKAALAIDQNVYDNRLVYFMYWMGTNSYDTRELYYGGFVCPPAVFVDGKEKNYTDITGHKILGGAINRKSGVDLQIQFDGSILNASVTNTAEKDLDELYVRVYQISQADMGSHPNEMTAIIAELPLVALADGDSDEVSVSGIALPANELLVVFVQNDANMEILRGEYVPQAP